MSNSATAAIAIAAAVVAVLALLAAFVSWLQLRRVRSSQQVMLGGGKDDLVDFAVSLQSRIDDLHRAVDEIAGCEDPFGRRVGGAPAHQNVSVRVDVELVFDEFGARIVTDRDENPGDVENALFTGGAVEQPQPGDAGIA